MFVSMTGYYKSRELLKKGMSEDSSVIFIILP